VAMAARLLPAVAAVSRLLLEEAALLPQQVFLSPERQPWCWQASLLSGSRAELEKRGNLSLVNTTFY